MPETSTVTSAVVKPVLSFQSASYTADGSIIVVLGQTLTFGSLATLVNLATPQAISLFSGGTKAVIGSSTQMLVDIISTEITVQTETAASSVPPPSGSVSPPAGSASPAATITTSTSSQSDPTSNTSGFVGASPTSTELATSNSTASSHHSSPKGISPGASAGIGIGCAAAGALIAAVLIFFILRRRRHNNRHDAGEFSPTDKNPSSFKQAEATTRSLDPGSTSGSSAFALAERDLPLPLEDAAIGGELSRLQTLIKNYAQSYYHTSSVATRNADPSDLGSNLPIPASRLAGMLADPRTRIAAIRFCLMWIITSRNALNSEPNQSLLPLEVINLLRLMPGANEPNSPPSFPPWRALTHRLLSPSSHPLPTTTSSPSSPTPNAASLQLARTTLDSIFQPFVDPTRDSYERMSKLEGILERGARFGWMLFGQMNELGIDWMGEREQGRLVLVEREMGRGGRGGGLGKGGRVLWEGEQVRWGGVAELKGDDYVMES